MKFSWLTVPENSLDKEHRCIVRHENNKNGADQEIIFPPIKTDVTTVDPKDSYSKDANDVTTVDPKDNYSEDANEPIKHDCFGCTAAFTSEAPKSLRNIPVRGCSGPGTRQCGPEPQRCHV
ncbi:PREDICTED: TCR gamma alternate reading frame protein isoform X2 [Rhinopithecus bieti]|uniref:TCR gamma alternate reading frame protein isoform X2 n=1 Tax=Rhinopithecus bieti TaxID=61621 RepID=UPI00083C89EF|nr:PREDICTED: TCR gamma alternate reading frame protein isoform X2 [Rhinopithecus bieti]XP_017715654.1 PREDICTED: TCR gamma alternate reading frame protein isoform X2 [Rhinopithecus bieti]